MHSSTVAARLFRCLFVHPNADEELSRTRTQEQLYFIGYDLSPQLPACGRFRLATMR